MWRRFTLDLAELAIARHSEGFSCSQSVFSVLAPGLGLPLEAALRVAAPLGGGIANSGNVCGAVTGALLAIGLKYGATEGADKESKEKTYALAREFMGRFRARHGDVMCRTLLGHDVNTPEGRALAREQGLFDTLCNDLIRDAVEVAQEVLG
jgi:C_GCAxxG_C_C family probable redox protein